MGSQTLDLLYDRLFRQPLGFSFDPADYASLSTLSLAPATILIALCPLFYYQHRGDREAIASGSLLWGKMAFATTMLAIELLTIAAPASLSSVIPEVSFHASSTNCLATVCLLAIVHSTHKRTFQSSSLLSMWLLAGIVCDSTRARLCSSFPYNVHIVALGHVGAALKVGLLTLEELPKLRYIKDANVRRATRWQSTCGLLTRNLIVYPYEELSLGFRNVNSFRQLEFLDPDFSARRLYRQYLAHWLSVDKTLPYCLMYTCVITLLSSIMSTALSCVLFAIFHSLQPVYIYCVVCFLENTERTQQEGFRIIFATLIIFLGKTITKAARTYSEGRLIVSFRAMLINAIYEKSLRRLEPQHKDFSTRNLIDTNLEAAANSIQSIFVSFKAAFTISAWVFILILIHGKVSIFMLLPCLLSQFIGWRLGKRVPAITQALAESTKKRISKATMLLAELRALRIIGIEEAAFKLLDSLHNTEITCSIAIQLHSASLIVTSLATNTFLCPVLITTKLLFLPQLPGLYLRTILTTAATFVESAYSFFQALSISQHFSVLSYNISCIRDYLLLEEDTENVANSNKGDSEQGTDQRPEVRMIEFRNVSLAPLGLNLPVLVQINITLNQGELMMVAGPKKSGKSTLLLSLLYESSILQGSAYVKPTQVAYCGQIAWISNTSIRCNITGGRAFNPGRYERVLEACCLQDDLENLPHHDQTLTDEHVSNLTESQKQKIALARAVYSEREIIVLDEIFGSWDLITANKIFSLLFGLNGLLRNSATTVVMAAYSIPYFQFANRVLAIEADGTSALHVYSSEPIFHHKLARLVNNIEAASQTMKGNTTEDTVDNLEREDEDFEAVQQQDRFSRSEILALYLNSLPSKILVTCVILAVIAGPTEVGGAAYFRLCVAADIKNRWLFFGFSVFSSLSALATALCFWLLFTKAVPSSAKSIHRRTLKATLQCTLGYITTANQESVRELFETDIAPLSNSIPSLFIRLCYGYSGFGFQFTMVALGTTSPFLVVLFGTIMFLVILQNYLRASSIAGRLRDESAVPLYSYFTESAAGLHYIRSFGWQHQRKEHLYELVDKYQRAEYHIENVRRWLSSSYDFVSLILALLVIFSAVYLESSPSAVAVAFFYLFQFTSSGEGSVRLHSRFTAQCDSLVRIHNFVESTPLEAGPNDDIELHEGWPRNGKVLFEKISVWHNKRDDDAPPVLRDVTAYIPGGWKVGIVGRPSSGKTSLILALLGFLKYTGRIVIDGVDISTVPRQVLRERIVTISQDSIESDGTVRSCLDPWGLHNARGAGQTPTDEQMEMVLRRLKLWNKISEKGGLDGTMADMDFTSDQRKMVCVARACIHKLSLGTRLVVVDDALAGFHPRQYRLVRRAMREFMWDCTILMVAHRLESLANVRMTIQIVFESARVRIHHPLDDDSSPRHGELPPAMKNYGPVEEIPAELEEIVRLSEHGEESRREQRGESSRQHEEDDEEEEDEQQEPVGTDEQRPWDKERAGEQPTEQQAGEQARQQ